MRCARVFLELSVEVIVVIAVVFFAFVFMQRTICTERATPGVSTRRESAAVGMIVVGRRRRRVGCAQAVRLRI
jgi:hypothetical protein